MGTKLTRTPGAEGGRLNLGRSAHAHGVALLLLRTCIQRLLLILTGELTLIANHSQLLQRLSHRRLRSHGSGHACTQVGGVR